ncbi:uncharacterized protein [Malus domestica]|uniref:uncharacterized protein isoform X3 n=1 Tax=Malus domestica TaxID=3750 RepID=UPI003975BFAC
MILLDMQHSESQGMTIYLRATSLLEMSSGGCFILLCRNISDMVHGPWYIEVGQSILNSLNLYTKVERGFANIRDVTTMQLEDHQHSFFLAETPESKRDVCASMSSYNNEFVGMWRRTS